VVEHSIGNGEVDSSILSGSTIHLIEISTISLDRFASPSRRTATLARSPSERRGSFCCQQSRYPASQCREDQGGTQTSQTTDEGGLVTRALVNDAQAGDLKIVLREGWGRAFDDPIALPNGRKLNTLRDAASYITGLPEKMHKRDHWQTAMQALMLCAERGQAGADPMLARIAVARAPPRRKPRP
jgi:hypothetical protein